MIEDLDEALRHLLIREMPIKNGEIDIQFNQPKREWSARLSRPTLNLFLYDVRENVKLRHTAQGWDIERRSDGTAIQRRRPFRADLHYLLTAWATEPEDEHRLLARALMGLFRVPEIPGDLLPENLHDQPSPITMKVAQYDTIQSLTDLWSALDNELRPALTCMVTMALNPYQPITGPLVRTREIRFGQAESPALTQNLLQPAGADVFWTIGGTLRSQQPLDPQRVRLTLVERNAEIEIKPEGRFSIGNLETGDYTLEFTAEGGVTRRYPIKVPAPDYEFEV
ncbi:hypothetical protein TFLX_03001 [Thermoflexales bacterium]|nr:hypothetical protein TFLX_03001 [Thermoflexales bacterium]